MNVVTMDMKIVVSKVDVEDRGFSFLKQMSKNNCPYKGCKVRG